MLSECMRIKFRKIGRLKYISHLDLQRTFSTGLIRAGIPVWYSKGFNPHPKLVFALTVSVGSESDCELLDIKLEEPIEKEEALERLRGAFTSEMEIVDVYTPERKFSEIAYSKYEIFFENDVLDEDIDKLFDGEIVITRKTKSGEKCEDIRYMVHSAQSEGKRVTAILGAGDTGYLNPDYFVKALEEKTGKSFGDYLVRRIGMLDKDLNIFK